MMLFMQHFLIFQFFRAQTITLHYTILVFSKKILKHLLIIENAGFINLVRTTHVRNDEK